MTQTSTTTTDSSTRCDPSVALTRSLLGYGVLAGPFYVTVSLTQAFTREGFDLTRHAWSLLSNGGLGWIQIANFLLTGAMVLAAAVGLRRALVSGRGAVWVPRLIAGYGAEPDRGRDPAGRPGVRFPGRHARPARARSAGTASGTWSPARSASAASSRPASSWASRFAAAGSPRLGGLLPAHRAGVPGKLPGYRHRSAAAAVITLAFVGAVVLAWGWLSALSRSALPHASR